LRSTAEKVATAAPREWPVTTRDAVGLAFRRALTAESVWLDKDWYTL
jgi:hypothetical protein